MATAHLIHGYLGAGKTTFARRLERETGGIRFSADEWYMRLYVGEGTTHHLDDVLWERMMAVLDELWPAVVARGVEVVLDFGFWSRATRDRARALALSAGAEVALYHVVCDEEVARQRCAARNQSPEGSFRIESDAFDELRGKFEPADRDENSVVVDTTA